MNFKKKNFDSWNEAKKIVNLGKSVFCEKGEIWMASLGLNIGREQDGKNQNFDRPVLVLRSFGETSLVLPMTSKPKTGNLFLKLKKRENWVILCQAKTVDNRRLRRRVQIIDHAELKEIQAKFFELIKTTPPKGCLRARKSGDVNDSFPNLEAK